VVTCYGRKRYGPEERDAKKEKKTQSNQGTRGILRNQRTHEPFHAVVDAGGRRSDLDHARVVSATRAAVGDSCLADFSKTDSRERKSETDMTKTRAAGDFRPRRLACQKGQRVRRHARKLIWSHEDVKPKKPKGRIMQWAGKAIVVDVRAYRSSS
jgi:hypothetical protein